MLKDGRTLDGIPKWYIFVPSTTNNMNDAPMECTIHVALKVKYKLITSEADSETDRDRHTDAITDALEALGYEVDVRSSEIEPTN